MATSRIVRFTAVVFRILTFLRLVLLGKKKRKETRHAHLVLRQRRAVGQAPKGGPCSRRLLELHEKSLLLRLRHRLPDRHVGKPPPSGERLGPVKASPILRGGSIA